jgi:hypothetical protein
VRIRSGIRTSFARAVGSDPFQAIALIDLAERPITDDDMDTVRSAHDLEILIIAGCPITDEGIGHLRDVSGLACVDMRRTRVGDKGFQELVAMPDMRLICVGGSQISQTAISAARRARPDCTIVDEIGSIKWHIAAEDSQ